MSSIYGLGRQFQQQLLQHERAAASEMVRYYGTIWQSLNAQIQELAKAYYADPERSAQWLYRYERLATLRSQTEAQIREFAAFSGTSIRAQQLYAVEQAQQHAEQLIRLALGELPEGISIQLNRLPVEALSDLVGLLGNGSPLRDLLNELPGMAGQAVADGLVTGLALGWNPRRIASTIREALGNNLVRALRIARTETLRSYRESTLRNYQGNAHVLHGWIWMSARNERTCAMCWAMHGTTHGLDEHLDDHPNGRCTMLPWTKSWAELGFAGIEDRPPVERGINLFVKLDPEKQRSILGPAKYAAWRDGKFELKQITGRRSSARWGSMRYEKSLKELLGDEAEGYTRLALSQAMKSASTSVDDLIRIGALGVRDLSPQEIVRIRAAIAEMPFETRTVKTLTKDRGHYFQGQVIGKYAPSDFYHLFKHTQDSQWKIGTTFEEYLSDLKNGITDPEGRIVTYFHQGGPVLGFFGQNKIDPIHLGDTPEPYLCVVYSVKQRAIITGYQTGDLANITIEEGARWIK